MILILKLHKTNYTSLLYMILYMILYMNHSFCSFFKTLNPCNFQTNNTRKLPLVQMNKLFTSFSMMYHKCQKSLISKSSKTTEKKNKVDRAQSPSPKSFWVGTIIHIKKVLTLSINSLVHTARCYFSIT